MKNVVPMSWGYVAGRSVMWCTVMPSVLIADRDSGKYKTNIFREHTYDLLYSQRGDILQIIYLDVQPTFVHFCPPSAKLMFQA